MDAKKRYRPIIGSSLIMVCTLLVAACSNPLFDTIYKVVGVANGAQADCTLRYGFGISPTFEIPITFTKDMDRSSVVLGGTMAEEAVAEWSNTRNLFIRPKTTWSSRADHTIIVTCNDAQGFPCSVDRIFGILENKTLYVSPNGASWNCGRKDEPLDSILAAVQMALIMYPDDPTVEIHVAEGTYISAMNEGYATGMFNAQKLYGGYSLDFTARDPAIHRTIIGGRNDSTATGNTAFNIDGCGSATVMDGFTVNTSGVENSVGIWIHNSAAMVNNVIVNLFAVNGAAVYVNDGSACHIENSTLTNYVDGPILGLVCCISSPAVIVGNTISSTLQGSQTGIVLWTSSAIVSGNEIRLTEGLEGDIRVGIQAVGYSPTIRNNVIDAGFGPWVVGIRDTSASPAILNNTIYAGSGLQSITGAGAKAYAIYNEQYGAGYASSCPHVINNLVMGGGEGENNAIYAADAGSIPFEVKNNGFSGFTGLSYDSTNDVRQDLYDYLTKPDWKLQPLAPGALRTGGADLSGPPYFFSVDKADAPRPSGAWSMGAYQWQ